MRMNKKIVLTLFIAILAIFCISSKVEASYSASSKTVDSGASVSVTITSTEKLQNFDVECTDTGGLIYKTCTTSVAGAIPNPSGKKISYALYGGEATTLGTYTFTAPEVTEQTKYTVKFIVNEEAINATITVKPKEDKTTNSGTTNNNTGTNNGTTNNNTGSNNAGSNNTGSNSGTVIEKPKEKSTNAYLSTLGVTPKEYDFSGFKKTTMSYSVTVPNDVDSLKVLYKTADSNAKVKVTGNSGFEVGSNNTIKIVVTAEDGKTTKTYTIKVTKLAEEEDKPGNVIEDEEGLFLTSLELKGIELSPEFVKDTYSYTATLNETDITEVEVNAKANKEDANIEISGNTNLVVGENTINIVVKEKESSVQTVYQIVLTKEEVVLSTTTEDSFEDSNLINNLMENIKKYVIIGAIIIVGIILIVIILICLLRKENKRLKNQETMENNEEYDIYKNDENEFINNEVEEKIEKETNETETNNEGRKTRRREKGRHSK